MKKTFLKTIGAVLAVLTLSLLTQNQASAQDAKAGSSEPDVSIDGGARALEGSWTVQATLRNCTTGDPISTFAKLVTFAQGGTAQEDSVGAAPLARTSAHGYWYNDGPRHFSYALQFFRFNADGSYGNRNVARWQVDMDPTGASYTASAAIQIFNPGGVLVGTACATETATRFQ
jgi:hypothetical protein